MSTDRTTISLSRKRAAYAYDVVSEWEKAPWKIPALKLARGLPIDIRTQGLCVTLATLTTGKSLHEKILADLLGKWVMDESPRKPLMNRGNADRSGSPGRLLLASCVTADRYVYMAAQIEAFAIAEQIKLFATALYGKEIL